jgi:hypothetical protein
MAMRGTTTSAVPMLSQGTMIESGCWTGHASAVAWFRVIRTRDRRAEAGQGADDGAEPGDHAGLAERQCPAHAGRGAESSEGGQVRASVGGGEPGGQCGGEGDDPGDDGQDRQGPAVLLDAAVDADLELLPEAGLEPVLFVGRRPSASGSCSPRR